MDIDILVGALTVDGEARGSTQEDRVAIAHCLLNRMKAKKWWGKGVEAYADHSMAAVCLKPKQFSCWNAGDPNSTRLHRLRAEYRNAIQQKSCRASLKAVIDAADGWAPDPTNGATHYLTTEYHISPKLCPKWAKGRTDYIEIGAHRFFAGVA